MSTGFSLIQLSSHYTRPIMRSPAQRGAEATLRFSPASYYGHASIMGCAEIRPITSTEAFLFYKAASPTRRLEEAKSLPPRAEFAVLSLKKGVADAGR